MQAYFGKITTKTMIREGSSSSSMPSPPFRYLSLVGLTQGIGSTYSPWFKELKSEERGLFLIRLLLACANQVAAGNIDRANVTLDHISLLASPCGDTMQRIAAYFTEAFADRLIKGYLGIYKALTSTQMSCVSEKIVARKMFFDLLPFLRISFLITNQAILEAVEDEKVIHIIDLHSSEPAQWVSLLQALSVLPQGPPHLKITGINEHKEVLNYIATQLNEEAEKLDIPFQFNPVVSRIEDVDVENLSIKTGEALVINSVLQLHSLLAFQSKPESLSYMETLLCMHYNPRKLVDNPDVFPSDLPKLDKFLKSLSGFSPKLMVITEQESNHNGDSLMERVMESLNFYAALFDSLESTTSRTSTGRVMVEKMFGEEIKNIIANEGSERHARHEKLDKWIQRIEIAGFCKMPGSYHGLLVARRLLQCSSNYHGYNIKDENGCFLICWQDRPLYSISAWRST